MSYPKSPGLDESCRLTGFSIGGDEYVGNLGSILIAAIAILVTLLLIGLAERKLAAVGRREMQLFLFIYILVQICEIFTIGLFPLNKTVRIAFTGAHLGLILACTWILLINAIIGYQLWEDGTLFSMGMSVFSASMLCIGTAYIALDTGFSWTGYFNSSLNGQNRSIGLYITYQLLPLIFIVIYFILTSILVLRILGELRPMIYLTSAAILFTIGQVFNYVVSIHICEGSSGKLNGAFFETLFTLTSVVMVWVFWSSITEDDWPTPENTLP
ncbi:putative chitin synthase export chaperone [Erysiphe necator]|uniref:Putative chitin synthase export chaperone n=1 Tax=Uncinula necator TaxID=52586 RepID=A0A0B1P317_UNCNE|nr:putative chitin synthase export chaperone [Erysiphe necator]